VPARGRTAKSGGLQSPNRAGREWASGAASAHRVVPPKTPGADATGLARTTARLLSTGFFPAPKNPRKFRTRLTIILLGRRRAAPRGLLLRSARFLVFREVGAPADMRVGWSLGFPGNDATEIDQNETLSFFPPRSGPGRRYVPRWPRRADTPPEVQRFRGPHKYHREPSRARPVFLVGNSLGKRRRATAEETVNSAMVPRPVRGGVRVRLDS
jgi:hypothetical protein